MKWSPLKGDSSGVFFLKGVKIVVGAQLGGVGGWGGRAVCWTGTICGTGRLGAQERVQEVQKQVKGGALGSW